MARKFVIETFVLQLGSDQGHWFATDLRDLASARARFPDRRFRLVEREPLPPLPAQPQRVSEPRSSTLGYELITDTPE